MDYINDKTRQSKHSRTWTKRRDIFKHIKTASASDNYPSSNIPSDIPILAGVFSLSFWEDNGAVVYLQVLISLIWNDVTTPFAFTVICEFT